MIVSDKYAKEYKRSIDEIYRYITVTKYPKKRIYEKLNVEYKTFERWFKKYTWPPDKFIEMCKVINSKK